MHQDSFDFGPAEAARLQQGDDIAEDLAVALAGECGCPFMVTDIVAGHDPRSMAPRRADRPNGSGYATTSVLATLDPVEAMLPDGLSLSEDGQVLQPGPVEVAFSRPAGDPAAVQVWAAR